MKVLILYIYSKEFGSGHFKRVLNYQREFKKHNISSNIVNLVAYRKFKNSTHFRNIFKRYDFILLDLSNQKFRKKLVYTSLYTSLKENKKKIGLIDGLGKEQIFPHKYFNFVILPYYLTKKNFSKKIKYFIGPEFLLNRNKFILDNRINNIKNVLVTSGGSDLNNSILKIIRLINQGKINIQILRIIIGPFFEKKYLKKIKILEKKVNFKFKYLKFEKKFEKNLKNVDLVITSSGLTKYNLIGTKIPFIVYCENKMQQNYHKGFDKKKICLTLKNLKIKKNNINLLRNFIVKANFRAKYKFNKYNYLDNSNKFLNFIKFLKNEFKKDK